jgi:hypothetical protein
MLLLSSPVHQIVHFFKSGFHPTVMSAVSSSHLAADLEKGNWQMRRR